MKKTEARAKMEKDGVALDQSGRSLLASSYLQYYHIMNGEQKLGGPETRE